MGKFNVAFTGDIGKALFKESREDRYPFYGALLTLYSQSGSYKTEELRRFIWDLDRITGEFAKIFVLDDFLNPIESTMTKSNSQRHNRSSPTNKPKLNAPQAAKSLGVLMQLMPCIVLFPSLSEERKPMVIRLKGDLNSWISIIGKTFDCIKTKLDAELRSALPEWGTLTLESYLRMLGLNKVDASLAITTLGKVRSRMRIVTDDDTPSDADLSSRPSGDVNILHRLEGKYGLEPDMLVSFSRDTKSKHWLTRGSFLRRRLSVVSILEQCTAGKRDNSIDAKKVLEPLKPIIYALAVSPVPVVLGL